MYAQGRLKYFQVVKAPSRLPYAERSYSLFSYKYFLFRVLFQISQEYEAYHHRHEGRKGRADADLPQSYALYPGKNKRQRHTDADGGRQRMYHREKAVSAACEISVYREQKADAYGVKGVGRKIQI